MAELRPEYLIDKAKARASFARAASGYDAAAVVQREMCARMLERLDLVKLAPAVVLDVGSGTGTSTAGLIARYRGARVIALDLAVPMLQRARARHRWWRRPAVVCGDAEALPLAEASVDLLFSNLTVQWCNDLDRAFAEFRRVLRPGGLAMFTTFGPDTLRELRAAWDAVDAHTHVNVFMDMHDVGDALVRARFADPVMDVERLTVHYPDLAALMSDLKQIGARNVTGGRARGLTGKGRLAAVREAYEGFRVPEGLPASYEVVHGHAWRPSGERPGDEPGVATVPLEALRRARRR
ncbi:MAG: malonyl-ACP O-methyltransferase BioC [Gammaproteobacteria bacterium]|nr:malonyl-ACP O-methyltransferase BioC [Gammaproteobacteria bacterium]